MSDYKKRAEELGVELPSKEEALELCKELRGVNKNYTVVLHCMAPPFDVNGIQYGGKYTKEFQNYVNGQFPMMIIKSSIDEFKPGDFAHLAHSAQFQSSIVKVSKNKYNVGKGETTEEKEAYLKERGFKENTNKRYLMSIIFTMDITHTTSTK